MATDHVCPTKDTADSCANDFQFSAVYHVDVMETVFDGILGLWSGNKSGYDKTGMLVPALV